MRWMLFAAAVSVSATAGAAAAVLDVRAPDLFTNTGAIQSVCQPVKFNVYFERGQATLSDPAQHMIDMVGGHVQGCAIGSVAIETPANEVASPEGRRIAGERGAAILHALHTHGVDADHVIISRVGDANEPQSAAPPRMAISIDASAPPLAAKRAAPKTGEEV